MEKTHFIINRFKRVSIFFLGFLLIIFMLYGCAHHRPQLSVSQYRFNFNDETYRIRSISSEDKTESYNELIGANFIAADYDQDRIIDYVLLGEVNLSKAQEIYEYGLNEVTKENKLQIRNPNINRYVRENNKLVFEIRSFRPIDDRPFNEFKITDNRLLVPEITVIVDQNADGTLDEVLKGAVTLEKVQSKYTEVIEVGLQKQELVKVNNTILVKKK